MVSKDMLLLSLDDSRVVLLSSVDDFRSNPLLSYIDAVMVPAYIDDFRRYIAILM